MSLRFSCISASWWSRRRGGALQRLDQPLSVANLARHAGWAPVRLRGASSPKPEPPQRWLTAQRLLEARRLLELTDLPIDQIAHRSGLGSAATCVSRSTVTPRHPGAYRRLYQATPPRRRGLGTEMPEPSQWRIPR